MFLIFNGHKGIQFCLGDFKSTKNWQISTILTKSENFWGPKMCFDTRNSVLNSFQNVLGSKLLVAIFFEQN